MWDFGDGTTSTISNPKHYYKNPGNYTVTLTAKKDCYEFTLKKLIKVSKTEKYATSNPKKLKTKS
jgi:PKD repeat protein